MVTMILGGLWHGADMTFVLWGTVHGFALCLHRLLNESGFLKGFRVIPGFGLLSWMLTLSWVVFCFTLFRCDSIGTFFELISRLTAGGKDQLAVQLWALVLWVGVAHVVVYRYRPQLSAVFRRAPVPAFAFAIGIATSVALFFTPINNAPFIYFQF
jgi:alginate O-acetyltransferase complex protein AlgI